MPDYRPEPPQKFQQKGERKGAGKGKKGKDKGKGGPRCAAATADGTKICYKFNNEKEMCKKLGCPFAHVCVVCFAEGLPMYSCTRKP